LQLAVTGGRLRLLSVKPAITFLTIPSLANADLYFLVVIDSHENIFCTELLPERKQLGVKLTTSSASLTV